MGRDDVWRRDCGEIRWLWSRGCRLVAHWDGGGDERGEGEVGGIGKKRVSGGSSKLICEDLCCRGRCMQHSFSFFDLILRIWKMGTWGKWEMSTVTTDMLMLC